jgi:hypothetical protein
VEDTKTESIRLRVCKRKFLGFAILILAFPIGLQAQPDPIAKQFMDSIRADELRMHLEVVASDEFEGRETGKKGQKLAAEYLAAQFEKSGLQTAPGLSDYFQRFELLEIVPGGQFRYGKAGQLAYASSFLYTGVDTLFNHKANVTFGFVPESFPHTEKGEIAWILFADDVPLRQLFASLRGLGKKGYSGVVVALSQWNEFKELFGHRFGGKKLVFPDQSGMNLPIVFVDQSAIKQANWSTPVQKWLKNPKGEVYRSTDNTIELQLTERINVISTENVLGVIPGTDLAHEVLVLTAHYDHLGIEDGELYNGADDNGTGTVALIELAESFALAKKYGHGPRRTLLIMPVTGEEKGLLGSKYYTDNPVFPMVQTIANLNIDMIGRTDVYQDSANYIYVIGSDKISQDLHQINEKAAQQYGKVALDYRYNSEEDPNRFYYRSDHYNFVVHGVPSIFYFSGVHDDYHKPTDTVDKIDFSKVEHITRLVFLTAWILANEDNRPLPDQKQ